MSESLLWRATSRFHDWRDHRFLGRWLAKAAAAGILTGAGWVSTEPGGPRKPLPVDRSKGLAAQLLAHLPERRRVKYLEAGGDEPAAWNLHLLVPSYHEPSQRVDGMGVAALTFEGESFADEAGSAKLREAFRAAHSPDDTEYAGIHWYDRWERLNSSTYDPAITYTPMFSGVVWANFLGLGHLDQFDLSLLRRLDAHEVTWIEDRGLFVFATARLADVQSGESERHLAALTQLFREARRVG